MPLFAIIPAAERLGLAAIAKTDHDSVSGCSFLIEEARHYQVEYIPGVELSTAEGFHILGYYVNPNNPALVDYTETEKAYGRLKLQSQLKHWHKAGGNLPDDLEVLIAQAKELRPDGEVSIKQICNHLVGGGFFKNYDEAFQDCGSKTQDLELPPNTPPAGAQAIATIMAAGGVAAVAHPKPDTLPQVEEFLKAGAVGVGAYRTKGFSDADRQFWIDYADEHDIILTGGTDWHGPVETWNIEVPSICPYTAVEQLKEAVRRIHGHNQMD